MSPSRGLPIALSALMALVTMLLAGCEGNRDQSERTTAAPGVGVAPIALSSPAFPAGGVIPRQFTCDGAAQSPPLSWAGVPQAAAEIALTVEDPDAPNGTLVHWVVYGIDSSVTSLEPGATAGTQGINGFARRAYGGPCPPKGTQHRYVFTLSALKRATALEEGATAEQLAAAMTGATIGQGRLIGRYGR